MVFTNSKANSKQQQMSTSSSREEHGTFQVPIPRNRPKARDKHHKNATFVTFLLSIIGMFCVSTMFNIITNHENGLSITGLLSFDGLAAGSINRIATTNDYPKQTESDNNDDGDMNEEQDDDQNTGSMSRTDVDIGMKIGSGNRLGSLVNRFRYYGTNNANTNHVNSNSFVMDDVARAPSGSGGSRDEDDDAKDKKDDGQSEDDQDKQDSFLFQQEIQKNFNASLYRNYREYKARSQRFPSVAERVKVYMSNWYLPPVLPCTDGSDSGTVNIDIDPRIQYNYHMHVDPITNESNTIVLLRQSQQILSATKHIYDSNGNFSSVLQLGMIPTRSRQPFVYNHTEIVKLSTDHFTQDAYKYYIPSLQRLNYPNTALDIETLMQNGMLPPIPIILQQGDAEVYRIYSPTIGMEIYRPFVPVVKKFRYAMSAEELQRVTSSQTEELDCEEISKAPHHVDQPTRTSRTVRVADPTNTVPQLVQPIISILSNYERHFNPLNDVVEADRPWSAKKNMAVYRGALTGANRARKPSADQNETEKQDVEYCNAIPRCSLVLNHGTSNYVDAKLVSAREERIPRVLRDVTMFGAGMNFEQMLEYKAIIMLEGNDVSTGLKWSLYSNSVVLTPKPTCTSWAMEELLVPYVHYVPIYENLTNVEEQVKWVMEHDAEAEQIAYNGKLWMMDLAYHNDVKKDTEEIIDETFRRYMKHFVYNPNLTI